ncbi:hypothetical protein LTR95_009187 [Oleoguttula sp. CCFEE 5521]
MRKAARKGKGKKEDLSANTMTQPKEREDVGMGGEAVTHQEGHSLVDELARNTESMSLGAQRPDSPVASATPKVIQQLRKDTPGKRSTSNKENVEPGNTTQYPALAPMEAVIERCESKDSTPVSTATPLRAKTQDSPIEALDELDEAV